MASSNTAWQIFILFSVAFGKFHFHDDFLKLNNLLRSANISLSEKKKKKKGKKKNNKNKNRK